MSPFSLELLTFPPIFSCLPPSCPPNLVSGLPDMFNTHSPLTPMTLHSTPPASVLTDALGQGGLAEETARDALCRGGEIPSVRFPTHNLHVHARRDGVGGSGALDPHLVQQFHVLEGRDRHGTGDRCWGGEGCYSWERAEVWVR